MRVLLSLFALTLVSSAGGCFLSGRSAGTSQDSVPDATVQHSPVLREGMFANLLRESSSKDANEMWILMSDGGFAGNGDVQVAIVRSSTGVCSRAAQLPESGTIAWHDLNAEACHRFIGATENASQLSSSDGKAFDGISYEYRYMRRLSSNMPWGAIQVVLAKNFAGNKADQPFLNLLAAFRF